MYEHFYHNGDGHPSSLMNINQALANQGTYQHGQLHCLIFLCIQKITRAGKYLLNPLFHSQEIGLY